MKYKIIVDQDDLRLDQIVFKQTGSVEIFEDVLQKNRHLAGKIFLEKGDEVVFDLPEKTAEKVKRLWE